MAPPQDVAEEQCDLVIVGAGLAAAHLVARLPDRLLKGTVVVDSSGAGWLAGWSERLARLAAPHVRTPVMQHPHAQPLALQAFAERRDRQQELTRVAKGFAPVPSLALFRDFCAAKVVGKLPSALRRPQHESVVRLEPLEGAGQSGCRVHCASGRVIQARAVVYAAANRQPVLPSWVRPLLATPGSPCSGQASSADAAAAGAQQELGSASGGTPSPAPPAEQAQHAQQPRLPPGIATSDQVDLRCAELAGRRVLIVGGGMAAGLLAAGAAERGADVTLICRRPLVPQPFETDVGWWGAKQLNEYRQHDSVAQRVRACQRARKQGSVHLPVWRRLTHQAAAGRLTVLEGWEVTVAEAQQAQQPSVHGVSPPAWRLTAKRRPADAALPRKQAAAPTLFQQAVAAATHAAASEEAAQADASQPVASAAEAAAGAASTAEPPAGQQEAGQERDECALLAHAVWLACGRAYDAATDPVLHGLLAQRPTLLAGGYPVLDVEHLCWPGAAVYVMGRGAMLSVGPCSGDMPGMRLAADRILVSLQRLDYSDAPAWEQAQARLMDRLSAQLATGGAGAGAPNTTSGTADAASGCDGEGGASEWLAAAVAAAARALPELALEAEGRMYEEPRPKKLVSKPDNLIDVSDLDPALPRRELSQYKFTDDEFEICVICQLDEAVPLENVRVLFGAQHLEMWAVGSAAAYHLHLPRLYGKVITKKCSAKVNQKAKKVYLLLRKESDAEWRFLKG